MMRHENRGFTMVVVLWVLAILTVIVLGFGRRAILERKAATYTLNHSQCMFMARGAVERGVAELRNKAVIDHLSETPVHTSRKQHWARPLDLLKEGGYFSLGGDEAYKDEVCEYHIRDEESRIALNSAPDEIFDEIEALSFSARRKIRTRRKGNRDEGISPQHFQTIEELLYIKEISEDDWNGTKRQAGLRNLLTCWGDGKINVNTASEEVLACIPDLDDNAVRSIVNYRVGSDGELGTGDDEAFVTLDEVREKAGVDGDSFIALTKYCKVDSQYFTIKGVATRRGGRIRASCTATVMLQGPLAFVIKWREDSRES